MGASAELQLNLDGGETLAGPVHAATVEYRGEPVDVESIIALDRQTLFLSGARQLHVTPQAGDLRGFVELLVKGRGVVRVDVRSVTSGFRAPEAAAAYATA